MSKVLKIPYIIWNNGDGSASIKYYESIELRDIVAEIFQYDGDIYETGTLEIEGDNVKIIDSNSEYRDANNQGVIITKEEILYALIISDKFKEAIPLLDLFSKDIRTIDITIGNKVKFIWSHYEYYEVFFDGILVGHNPASITPEEIIEQIKEQFNKLINYGEENN